jgi:hypothetical protein
MNQEKILQFSIKMLFGSLPGNQLFLAPCDCRARQTSKANKKEIVLFIQFELIFSSFTLAM